MKYDGFTVGQNIRALREAQKMSLEEFAFLVKRSTSHISQLEQGSRKLSMKLLYTVMTLFEVDANKILAIEMTKDNRSIDGAIAKLPKEQQLFVKTVVLQMIPELMKI